MKSLINMALFKEQLKRALPFTAILTFVFILIIVLPLYRMPSNVHDQEYIARMMINTLSMNNGFVIIFTAQVTVMAIAGIFSYLFIPKATTAMHSYPFNKNQLFFTQILVGLAVLILPMCFLSLALLYPITTPLSDPTLEYVAREMPASAIIFPNGVGIGETINTMPVVLSFFLRNVLNILFYAALSLLAIMLTGHGIICVLLIVALLALPPYLEVIFEIIQTYFIFGYAPSLDFAITYSYLNPSLWGHLLSQIETQHIYAPETLSPLRVFIATSGIPYIILTILLFAAAFFAYHKRPLERAGDSIVFKPITKLAIFFLSTAGMFVMAAFFTNIFRTSIGLHSGFILGFIITYYISQMIAEQSTRVWKKAIKDFKYYAIVVAGVYLLSFISLQSYSRYTPELADIESVVVDPFSIRAGFNINSGENYLNPWSISDSQFIENTLSLHKEIIENKNALQSQFWGFQFGIFNFDNRPHFFHVQYQLTNGKTVSRSYILPTYFVAEQQPELLLHENVLLSKSRWQLFRLPAETTPHLFFHIQTSNQGDMQRTELTQSASIHSFLAAIKTDVLANERYYTVQDYFPNSVPPKSSSNTTLSFVPEIYVESPTYPTNEISTRPAAQSYYRTYLNLLDSPNTTTWLLEHGYIDEELASEILTSIEKLPQF